MRKITALMIAGMTAGTLAGAAPANAAVVVCHPPWHCAYWARGPHNRWYWRGGWHSSGHWVHYHRHWVYRWR